MQYLFQVSLLTLNYRAPNLFRMYSYKNLIIYGIDWENMILQMNNFLIMR